MWFGRCLVFLLQLVCLVWLIVLLISLLYSAWCLSLIVYARWVGLLTFGCGGICLHAVDLF